VVAAPFVKRCQFSGRQRSLARATLKDCYPTWRWIQCGGALLQRLFLNALSGSVGLLAIVNSVSNGGAWTRTTELKG